MRRRLRKVCADCAPRYVKLSGPQRYERLMMIWAMGVWLLHAQGLAGIRGISTWG